MTSGRLVSILMAVLWLALRPVAAELSGTGSNHTMTAFGLTQTVYLEARRRVLELAEQQKLRQARHVVDQMLRGDPGEVTPPGRGTLSGNDRRPA